MPYTIRVYTRDVEERPGPALIAALVPLTKLCGFSAEFGSADPRRSNKKTYQDIFVTRVRLLKKKPYCGNHPGSCPVGSRKPMSSFLEWNDWVRFHRIINRVLDETGLNAEVWSFPQDVSGKMWIRLNNWGRRKYSWDEQFGRFAGQIRRVWNRGDKNDGEYEGDYE